jgi:hypothetical protein
MKLVIAGAHYFDGDSILIPHYTGEYWAVDCTEYKPIRSLMREYPRSYVEEHKNDYIEHDGTRYFYAEFGPFHTENMGLISDLSNLTFNHTGYEIHQ